LTGCGKTRRLRKKVQMRGAARQLRARRTACTLSVRPWWCEPQDVARLGPRRPRRAYEKSPTKQMDLFPQPASVLSLKKMEQHVRIGRSHGRRENAHADRSTPAAADPR